MLRFFSSSSLAKNCQSSYVISGSGDLCKEKNTSATAMWLAYLISRLGGMLYQSVRVYILLKKNHGWPSHGLFSL